MILIIVSFNCYGQNEVDTLKRSGNIEFQYKALIIPSVMIGYGIVGLENDALKFLNLEVKEEISEHIDQKLSIDDFAQYTPFVTVYGLNALGIKGKNNFKDRTIILATASILMAGSVTTLKQVTNVERPDASSHNSFPSGHTATAFMGAEFLYQEYRDVSLWYGISGYVVATGTGFFRLNNNRHWFTDVVSGAGFGILSTKIAYWVHPLIKRKLFKNKENVSGVAMPFYNGKEYGLGLSMVF